MSQFSPREDVWITCSSCGTPMIPLADYEIHKASESPGVGAELWQFLLFGWAIFVINYLTDLWTFEERKKKLATLKAEVLPTFPRSQVCPRCLELKRMR